MKSIKELQMFLLVLGGTICVLMFLFSSIVRYQSTKRKKALLHLELVTSLLLFSDFFAYKYQNDVSTLGYWIIHISNFLLFFLIYVELLGLNMYLRTFVYETKKGGSKRLKLINIAAYAGIIGILINFFTGHVYFIDAENVYHRGPLFYVSFVAPLVIYMVILSVVIQYRKIFPKLIFVSLLTFAVLPLTSSILQSFMYGLSLMNLSIGLCAIILFGLSLIDQNFFLMQIAVREKASGLPNSYGFITAVEKIKEGGKLPEYNAFHFDIIRMGVFNSKYGGSAGSEIIIKYARALRNSLDESEVLGRLGGNFFVAMVKKEHTKEFLEKLKQTTINITLPSGPEKVVVSSRVGVYGIETNEIDADQILNNVNMAGNLAKNMLRKQVVFLTPELQKKISDIRLMQETIPLCMAKKEFKPYYQPKVDIHSKKLCGAEALVRWEHDGKLIIPSTFVPVLEQNEKICNLDFYMLDYVCNDIRRWLDDGKTPPTISVNFSRKNLENPVLAEDIYNILKKYDIPPHLIQIEITETIDEYPMDNLKGVVLALQKYGMTAAIDDFGTGSASINLIMEVPFNVLKIDKSFISSTNEKDLKILGHIIAMANDVGADVITEGVETEEQLKILSGLGCPKIQGFYFDEPLSKTDFENRMENPDY